MHVDIDHLRQWIGNTQSDSEVLRPTTVRQFAATFDRDWPSEVGAEAPLLIHLCLAQPIAPMSALGRDGHPALGGFLPPVPLPRRMWAGGSFAFHGPILVGDEVTRTSTIRDVTLKEGRSGALCFVTVDHQVTSNGRTVISERQDIVYRDVPPPGAPAPKPAPTAPDGQENKGLIPTPTLLFRYSALTFNGHRIHYDKEFCTTTEGYPGLVVHGPMQATMLCQMAADLEGRSPTEFTFRSLSPLFDDAPIRLNADSDGKGLRLWTARPGGPVAMEAHAVW
ncbi:FAS1-like dehydratase domain-containing protein [Pseudoprimorskyibacter insulae]|uniref:Mesaconyl-C(4)-CoA hydratase n=1 Tax=Pseudoprimorskyibacter insulae TaxID=1695997 RepID=A0A2R8AV65_9RHOB|nr:MaoC family dehydratase N-terminal domain-containing protein [Pseudoprimorskyibacter insulae]SPF79906.1 Mesaconyl-C(4)-CoA hydratase [Pseudoprimorskyibacter insulae]